MHVAYIQRIDLEQYIPLIPQIHIRIRTACFIEEGFEQSLVPRGGRFDYKGVETHTG